MEDNRSESRCEVNDEATSVAMHLFFEMAKQDPSVAMAVHCRKLAEALCGYEEDDNGN